MVLTVRAPRSLLLSLAGLSLALTACSTGNSTASTESSSSPSATESDQVLTIYSGRSEELVGPLLDQLEEATGTAIEVRYGGSSELAAQLLEEGDSTRADLFFSQDAGALGALAKEGRLSELDESITSVVPEQYVDDENRWVATSARARVITYNPDQAPEVAQFTGIDEILDPKYKGKIGYAPTNSSFHSFVTALRVMRGEDAARQWLVDFKANEPVAFEKNSAVLNAVDAGEVSLGLINHYYWYEKAAEVGTDKITAQIRFLDSNDPGALINVAGVGVIAGTSEQATAEQAVQYLLSEPAQQYFADTTAEYPVLDGVTTTKHDLAPLDSLTSAKIDLNDLDSLDQTLQLLEEVGLV